MTNLNLRVIAAAIGRPAQLRADRIRRDTLTQLAAALRTDDDSELRNALDALTDAMGHDVTDHEIDALVADIEDLARMDQAAMDLSPGDVRQIAAEARAADVRGLLSRIPAHREAGAA